MVGWSPFAVGVFSLGSGVEVPGSLCPLGIIQEIVLRHVVIAGPGTAA